MNNKWLGAIIALIWLVVYFYIIISEIKKSRNTTPYGKTFIKKFHKIVKDIEEAQRISKHTVMTCFANGGMFKVAVKKDDTPEGIQYRTIPVYKSYGIYINDELVCREHIFKDKSYFEFSSDRKTDEVVTLVKEAHIPAREIIDKHNKELYDKYFGHKSFFEYSSSEDE